MATIACPRTLTSAVCHGAEECLAAPRGRRARVAQGQGGLGLNQGRCHPRGAGRRPSITQARAPPAGASPRSSRPSPRHSRLPAGRARPFSISSVGRPAAPAALTAAALDLGSESCSPAWTTLIEVSVASADQPQGEDGLLRTPPSSSPAAAPSRWRFQRRPPRQLPERLGRVPPYLRVEVSQGLGRGRGTALPSPIPPSDPSARPPWR